MDKFINTLKNIWKITDLRQKIMYTLGLILIYRIGVFVVLPGVDPNVLSSLIDQNQGGILGLIDMFAGGGFLNASVFALGIMPYISASIAVQLLTLAVPYFQKLQKEGESGRKKITQLTRYLTIAVTAVQSVGYVTYLNSFASQAIVLESTLLFTLSTMIVLTAGTIFCMWLGEKITDRGIGNGISLLITIGIIARLPFALVAEIQTKLDAGGGPIFLIVELAILVAIVMATIMLVQAVRRIPVQYAKRIIGNRQYGGGARQYIPLKLNASGVMPIIFAQALMFIPSFVGQFFPDSALMQSINNGTYVTSFWYNAIFFLLVILFTYFYTALIINPTQMADDMKRNNGFIPGVKPGRKTAEYIDTILSRITLPGSIFLGFVAILPAFAMLAGVNSQFAQFYGGTSLLILVAVMLDTLQQIESHLLMRHYDGLMKGSARIKGRNAVGASV